MDVLGWLDKASKAVVWLQAERKKRRDIFVLKAVSNAHRTALGFAITDVPIDLRTIEGLIAAAQLTEAGCHTGDSCYIEPLVEPENTAPYERQLKKVARKYGLPSLDDPNRLKKIETILHDMPDNLKWHPPDKWSIR
jgi:hypothetical protein